MYYLYVLKSIGKDWHYIGVTSDIEKRVAEHNSGKVRSTKPHRPLRLVYHETFSNNKEARKKESFLKRTAQARQSIFQKIRNGAIV